jgi:hypothetical protein
MIGSLTVCGVAASARRAFSSSPCAAATSAPAGPPLTAAPTPTAPTPHAVLHTFCCTGLLYPLQASTHALRVASMVSLFFASCSCCSA